MQHRQQPRRARAIAIADAAQNQTLRLGWTVFALAGMVAVFVAAMLAL